MGDRVQIIEFWVWPVIGFWAERQWICLVLRSALVPSLALDEVSYARPVVRAVKPGEAAG